MWRPLRLTGGLLAQALPLVVLLFLLLPRGVLNLGSLLQDQLATLCSDPVLWRLLAQAHHAAGQAALAHVATAEEYALGGNWRAAVEQLRLSRRALPALDFYTGSLVDARLKEFELEFQREQADRVRTR